MIYDDGIENQFEHAHQTGLRRGFDLGWSYKGRFDRQIISDQIDKLDTQHDKTTDSVEREKILAQKVVLVETLQLLKQHKNNKEFIT